MSIRRDIRLRKEYLLKKQQDQKDQIIYEKKKRIQHAIDSNTPIPTELRAEARELQHSIELDVYTDGRQSIDDEYAQAGLLEPKVCITTSRDPGSKLKQFAKEIKLCIPNSQAINRGGYRVDELVEACKKANFTDIVVLSETRGSPDGMIVSHLPYGPTAYFQLTNCVLRHDIPECQPASQAYPHLIIDGLNSKIGSRISQIIKGLYPIPKDDVKRVITFANDNDFISFRHHMYTKQGNNITLQEAGPRMELSKYCINKKYQLFLLSKFAYLGPYEIRLGTLDREEAEKEWVLRPYMNTSTKKQRLQ